MEDFEFTSQVHYMGTVYCTKAAWPIMRKQQYGRVVVTTSGSGTVGNFGQSNYGAAKMAVNGLINVLRLEGAKYNILCNAISPSAQHAHDRDPAAAAHGANTCGRSSSRPRSPGCAARSATPTARSSPRPRATTRGCSISSREGVQFDPDQPVTIEMVAEKIGTIRDLSKAKPYTGLMGTVEASLRAMGKLK